MKNKIHVFAIIRFDKYIDEPMDSFSVVKILPTEQAAEIEVGRLNDINGDEKTIYYWQTTRFFPDWEQ